MNYKVKFTNAPTQLVYASNRANAITQAINKTKGYLLATEQRRNVISAKQDN
jgi:hypothetical protein